MAQNLLNEFLAMHTLDEVLAGAPIEFERVPVENKRNLIAALIHCSINGPVSPHKETNFPLIGRTSIDLLVGHEVSNNGLRKSCIFVADWLNTKGYDKGYMKESFGNFWPLNSFVGTPN